MPPTPQPEIVLFKAKPHWIWLFRPALLMLFGLSCTCCSILAATAEPSPGRPPPPETMLQTMIYTSTCLLGLALIVTIIAVLRYIHSTFTLTNRRVILEKGVLTQRSIEIFLWKVDSVFVETSPLGRFLGYGTVIVFSGAVREPLGIYAKPQIIRQRIQDQVSRR